MPYPPVGAVQAKIDAAYGPASDAHVTEGQQIYARKPNMGEHDVTWSQREYGHLGLQKEYIRYKSVQRLTEAWACLQRARHAGVFASLDAEMARAGTGTIKRPFLRWASLGGGPGFELLAVKWFFERHYPTYDLDLVSLDLEGSWRASAEGLGLRFNEWDVNDGEGLEAAAGGPVDFALASYVLKMYMANERCARWMGAALNANGGDAGGLRAILGVSRDENLEEASRLVREIGGAQVIPLMDPGGGRDDRQIAFVPGVGLGAARGPMPQEAWEALTFPNVPYEEHKKKRHHQRGGGGRRRGGRDDEGRGDGGGGYRAQGGGREGGRGWGSKGGGGPGWGEEGGLSGFHGDRRGGWGGSSRGGGSRGWNDGRHGGHRDGGGSGGSRW